MKNVYNERLKAGCKGVKTAMNWTAIGIVHTVCAFALLVSTAHARSLSFLVTADTHFGYHSTESQNIANIQAMNTIATTAMPSLPRGVLVAGDLTNDGDTFDDFEYHYPLNGGTAADIIHFPVYECTGNHDDNCPFGWDWFNETPAEAVIRRHGSLLYSWDWVGVHLVSLDLYPSYAASNWLAGDLAGISPTTPVIIMCHYDWLPNHGQGDWNDFAGESAQFKSVIDDYNVFAIFHGHGHTSQTYQWEGYDLYTPGSPKNVGVNDSFGTVNITDDTFTWTEYSWVDGGATTLSWTKTATFEIPEPRVFIMLLTGLLIMAFGVCCHWFCTFVGRAASASWGVGLATVAMLYVRQKTIATILK